MHAVHVSTSPRLHVSTKKNVKIPEKIVILQKNNFEDSGEHTVVASRQVGRHWMGDV